MLSFHGNDSIYPYINATLTLGTYGITKILQFTLFTFPDPNISVGNLTGMKYHSGNSWVDSVFYCWALWQVIILPDKDKSLITV